MISKQLVVAALLNSSQFSQYPNQMDVTNPAMLYTELKERGILSYAHIDITFLRDLAYTRTTGRLKVTLRKNCSSKVATGLAITTSTRRSSGRLKTRIGLQEQLPIRCGFSRPLTSVCIFSFIINTQL